jgi:GYD domain
MGGRLNAFYNCLGEYDGVAIFEAPDEQTAHSIELAASQPGHLKETKISTLLPIKKAWRRCARRASRSTRRRKVGSRGLIPSFGEADFKRAGRPPGPSS